MVLDLTSALALEFLLLSGLVVPWMLRTVNEYEEMEYNEDEQDYDA